MQIKWLTKKVQTLFKVKDKSLHQGCKIYKDVCSCGENYIGEIIKMLRYVGMSIINK